MKATFILSENDYVKEKFDEIAQKYGTAVKFDDDGIGRFLIAPPKFQIKERLEEDNYNIKVWGATEEDIQYLKSIWGEPTRTEKQRLSPIEFAQEIVGVPDIKTLSKEQIMEIMELDDRQFTQYQRLLANQLRRPNPQPIFTKASEIMSKF
ncbi:MAG: hypothetical protein HZR80_15900 [Candidatus Heimdallarchaeota archaeon]